MKKQPVSSTKTAGGHHLTLGLLCQKLNLEFEGTPDLQLHQVCSLEHIKSHSVGLILSDVYSPPDDSSIAWVIPQKSQLPQKLKRNWIFAEDARYIHAQICQILHPLPHYPSQIHHTAIIGNHVTYGKDCFIGANVVLYDGVSLGDRVTIHSGVVLMENVSLGSDSVIYPQVTIYRDTDIGERCIIHANTVIGTDGFGFLKDRNGHAYKIPQAGNVAIGDDVEIGALCGIDRARFDTTTIEPRVKLDNLIHVGHNVSIGSDTMISAQTGISGSTSIGRRCMIGGKTGIVDHLQIGDDVVISSSKVTKNLAKSGTFGAMIPAMPLKEWWKTWAYVLRLKSLFQRVSNLEESIKSTKTQHDND